MLQKPTDCSYTLYMPEKKLTRREILNLNAGFRLVANLSGLQFAYTIARNSEQLKSEVRAIQKVAKAEEDYVTYDKDRVELVKKYAVKENGTEKIVGEGENAHYVISNQEDFDKELKELQKKHRKAIDRRIEQEKELDAFLDKEVEVVLFMLKFEDLPQNITPGQLEALSPILAKDDPVPSKKAKK